MRSFFSLASFLVFKVQPNEGVASLGFERGLLLCSSLYQVSWDEVGFRKLLHCHKRHRGAAVSLFMDAEKVPPISGGQRLKSGRLLAGEHWIRGVGLCACC